MLFLPKNFLQVPSELPLRMVRIFLFVDLRPATVLPLVNIFQMKEKVY